MDKIQNTISLKVMYKAMRRLILLASVFISNHALSGEVESCAQKLVRYSIGSKTSSIVLTSLSNEGSRLSQSLGAEGQLSGRFDQRITSSVICSSSSDSTSFEELKKQKLISLRLVNKSLKSSGSVSPVFLDGIAEISSGPVSSKDLCTKVNHALREESERVCDGFSTNAGCSRLCHDGFREIESVPFESLSYEQACKRVFEIQKKMHFSKVACESNTGPAQRSQAKLLKQEKFIERSPAVSLNENLVKREQIQRSLDQMRRIRQDQERRLAPTSRASGQ